MPHSDHVSKAHAIRIYDMHLRYAFTIRILDTSKENHIVLCFVLPLPAGFVTALTNCRPEADPPNLRYRFTSSGYRREPSHIATWRSGL